MGGVKVAEGRQILVIRPNPHCILPQFFVQTSIFQLFGAFFEKASESNPHVTFWVVFVRAWWTSSLRTAAMDFGALAENVPPTEKAHDPELAQAHGRARLVQEAQLVRQTHGLVSCVATVDVYLGFTVNLCLMFSHRASR